MTNVWLKSCESTISDGVANLLRNKVKSRRSFCSKRWRFLFWGRWRETQRLRAAESTAKKDLKTNLAGQAKTNGRIEPARRIKDQVIFGALNDGCQYFRGMGGAPLNIGLEVAKQLNFVISSCRLYDEGRYEEALRIAVAARVLFHNTHTSKAIIGGHYPAVGMKLVSTTMFKPGTVTDSNFLGFIELHPSIGGFQPCLDDGKRKEQIPWQQWWSVEPILALIETKEPITRRQLVLACANKDGGAHVDEIKPREYERLEEGLGIEVIVRFRGRTEPEQVKLRNANVAALRQIGHEILASPDLADLANSR
jgi:hypothetical protein